ncbi:MAG: thaumatin family protein, partial [Campylobacterales bacterium]
GSETSPPLKDLPGTSAKSDCHSASDWTTYIKPKVEVVKKGCPSAYSHQYDDPYSTFQCQNNIHGINMANYKITLCPSSKDNGISFD